MSEKKQYDYRLRCDNHDKDLVFNGEEIASTSTRTTYGDSQNRYSCVTLYKTESGKYILLEENISHWQGESNSQNALILDSLDEVSAHFTDHEYGLARWEKEFLQEVGIDLVQEI